ncbi:hypothetical protein NIES37_68750 [Tolypothrix tenuis PCC 7101]|uniref:Site-specific DNA-cytosine methylase n=1 Tax=Tolypothrix tenuis PCC 7101 TaxID=231146 RepID=A0A1Z4NB16_9CYAN|nr:hypothetical protein [Aulosira sp. FACHB-113]BAZ02862.1 hypothetical protein NIES37_68750 [Tolypothrix tenuis PCC 7101]BAZ78244.1 hypothetical protein NIES50_68770 [Aulosira laxa NIES-50]
MNQPSSSNSEIPATEANKDISHQADSVSATITVTSVEISELTEEEQRDRLHLERKVERAFFEAGKALMELRDRRLYRSTHKTFEDYCRDRFGHSRQKSNYLIAAADVYENLTTICCQISPTEDLTTNCCQILPTTEGQVRPITKLKPQEQWEVWQSAVQQAGGKVPTGRIVKDVVQRIMERTKVPNTYFVGEVCQILTKDNPELRGKGGCWAIVTQVNEFSCTVRMWDAEYTIGLKHLQSFNYLPDDCQQMQLLSDRISRVYSSTLEESVQKFLESLGKVNRPYLTTLEEKLLRVLESEILA